MPRINVLDKKTAELIAAGEVIERPSSVVKELVENSIDSGATIVTVEIKNGGVRLIRVTDNGCGIEPDDIPKAFLRHATSKVSSEDDLYRIGTLGFRGEALASVCAVSRVELLSRVDGSPLGYSYRINGGEDGTLCEAGCPVGTTIYVRDLFYNIPARMKFLKKDVTEGNAIATLLDRLALSHPEVSVRFIREGKQVLQTPGDGQLLSAIYAVYGKEFGGGMIPVKGNSGTVEVSGYIIRPENAKATRTMEHFFINERYVRSVTVMAAMEEAYRNSIMTGKFPGCVLHLNLPFFMVDVNVHPAKLEVKLTDEKLVFDAVYSACKGALSNMEQAVNAADTAGKSMKAKLTYFDLQNRPLAGEQQHITAEQYRSVVNQPKKVATQQDLQDNSSVKLYMEQLKKSVGISRAEHEPIAEKPMQTDAYKGQRTTIPQYTKQEAEVAKPNITVPPVQCAPAPLASSLERVNPVTRQEPTVLAQPVSIASPEPPMRLVGELFSTYIVAEQEDKLLLVDKHAAHERILFERLKAEQRAGHVARQLLLSSTRLSFSKELYGVLITNLDVLEDLGFAAEDFGGGSILVREIPAILSLALLEDTLLEIAEKLLKGNLHPEIDKTDDMLHSMACKAAVKGGYFTGELEQKKLLQLLCEDSTLRSCPHGRPITIALTRRELEKMFGRIT
ncbi:MAG: DNA mismatch repair endonuclease MutL [Angelakisella sp.]